MNVGIKCLHQEITTHKPFHGILDTTINKLGQYRNIIFVIVGKLVVRSSARLENLKRND